MLLFLLFLSICQYVVFFSCSASMFIYIYIYIFEFGLYRCYYQPSHNSWTVKRVKMQIHKVQIAILPSFNGDRKSAMEKKVTVNSGKIEKKNLLILIDENQQRNNSNSIELKDTYRNIHTHLYRSHIYGSMWNATPIHSYMKIYI